ncbi:MAG: insulinase family protein [Acidobacteriota bacterium]
MKAAALLVLLNATAALAAPRLIERPGQSPLVTIRLVFTTGAAFDPADKPGAANLTASMLASGGTRDLTRKQLLDAFYPMATEISVSTDKEMTTFVGETHLDNLDAFYALMRDSILRPGWRAADLERLRDDASNALKVTLRGNNDEELGKEVLYSALYRGLPYSHENLGTIAALTRMSMGDLQAFYKQHYTQANLMIGLAGGYPADFPARVRRDFAALPEGTPDRFEAAAPEPLARNQATLVQKDTRSVAWSLGYPISVRRGDPDYPALLLVQSWLGQHRSSSRLYDRMREARGLNYGDYAYIEYFPLGMFRFEPPPNIARSQQIFQVWIRPVEPPNAAFALRLAMYELDRLVREGIPPVDFERTRSFLSKYVNVLTKTKSAELGYAIDSAWYGIPDYNEYVKAGLAKLTVDDVNRAIRKHLRADRLQIAGIAKDTERLKAELTSGNATPITYNSPKSPDILEEDKIVEKWPFKLRPEDVTVVPAGDVFQN